jgi:hypothetical protein
VVRRMRNQVARKLERARDHPADGDFNPWIEWCDKPSRR